MSRNLSSAAGAAFPRHPYDDLPLLFVAKIEAQTLAGYRKAWLVLKELQDSGKIEIAAYQGVRI
jgi:hypothetical protein